MSVRNKLYSGFASILAVVMIAMGVIWWEVEESHDVATEIRVDDVPGVELYLILIDEVGDVYRDSLKIVANTPGARRDYESNKTEFRDAYTKIVALEKSSAVDNERLKKIEALFNLYTSEFERNVLPQVNPSQDSDALFRELDQLYDKHLVMVENLLDEASLSESAEAEKALLTLNDSFTAINSTIFILTIIAILSSSAVAYFLSHSITTRLTRLDEVAVRVANGDLTAAEIEDASSDELGNLAKSVNKMQASLVSLLGSISTVSTEVKMVTSDLFQISNDIVSGASSQADKASLIATAAEELSLTISEVAQQGNSTFEEAQRSEKSAEEGRSVIVEMVESIQQVSNQMSDMSTQMNTLGSHGEQIGSVIKVIEDIAEQTNLLALNAAIEAARAGEFGRGFAVVADEVRALAERTTNATQEVSGIIQSIQSGTKEAVTFTEENCQLVEIGVKQSSGAVTALEEIVSGAANVQSMVNSIATAAEEQTAVTKEIAADITAISDISEQSLALANRSSESTSGLNTRVTELEQLISKFKLS
ncbi:methyl-accepting chemotaxis protein [Vibrio sp. ZSDE26]|uniref:Methyl-accepting chemotaxis protein n=1 Tax=Vibrio amylolyticus TaxID=2847292 RepID=A0A9X1XNU6_9VIBR|nr:methyl-accepting chemotaxis protein [Vibrio amylolyticus]MCK6262899.1 methyl-accepting chemotaxis protein [Vibrio amylolyticus]